MILKLIRHESATATPPLKRHRPEAGFYRRIQRGYSAKLVQDIIKDINKRINTLPFVSQLSNAQNIKVRNVFKIKDQKALHYSYIQRFWKRPPGLSPELNASDLFSLFKGGVRVFASEGPGPVRITVGNKLLWIMFLCHPHIKLSQDSYSTPQSQCISQK